MTLVVLGRFRECLERVERAEQVFGVEQDTLEATITESARALTKAYVGDYEGAIKLFQKLERKYLSMGLRYEASQCQANAAEMLKKLSRFEDAYALYSAAASTCSELGHSLDVAQAKLGRASCLAHLNRWDDAIALYEESLEGFQGNSWRWR